MAKSLTVVSVEAEGIIKDIRANHRECIVSGRDALKHAIAAGELLWKLKEMLKHGEFTDAVEQKCEFSERTARLYMQASEGLPKLIDKLGKGAVVDISLSGIARLVSEHFPKSSKSGNGRQNPPKRVAVEAEPDPVDAEAIEEITTRLEVAAKKITGGTSFNIAEFESDSKDAFGNETPDELKKVFEIAEEFSAQRAKITGIKSWMTQRASHPGAAILSGAMQRIEHDLDTADSELKYATPYCVCIYCKNKTPKVANCNACKGLGWITEPIYKAAPKEIKEAGREKAKA